MSDSQTDFRIPDPQETGGQAGEATRDTGTDTLIDTSQLEGLFATGLSTTDLIIAGVVLLGLLGLVEAILVIVDEKGRRIGDKVAETIVVEVDA